jgi:predicted PurR-regulated permease PerM
MESAWIRQAAVVALLGVLLVLGFAVLQSFLVPLLWAAILAYVSWSPFHYCIGLFRGARTPAALLMTLLMTLAVIVPMASVFLLLRPEAVGAFRSAQAFLASGLRVPVFMLRLPLVGSHLAELNARWISDPDALNNALRELLNRSYGQMGALLGNVGRNLFKLGITVISLFFMYVDGDAMARQIHAVLRRFIGERADAYVKASGAMVKAVLVSLVLCALAQGVLAGLGYWVAGVPAPLVCTAVTTLAALIPFAVNFAWGAVVVWLFATGHITAAIALLIWCLVVMNVVDSVVRSLVISSGATRMPFLLSMFGALGGLSAFGLIGLFVGPVILAVLLSLWREGLLQREVELR